MESPTHYTRGSIEVWDFIRDQDLNYHLGNAIKYICRAGFKDASSKTEDLKKAIHYLENELQHTPTISVPSRASYGVPYPVWDTEFDEQPDYATGFDR
jgi:hypothetical protein